MMDSESSQNQLFFKDQSVGSARPADSSDSEQQREIEQNRAMERQSN
jgi:hypothetical protein